MGGGLSQLSSSRRARFRRRTRRFAADEAWHVSDETFRRARRNHFPIATKPSGNDHQLRLAQIMRVQCEFVAVFYVEFFSKRRQTHLSESDAGRFAVLRSVRGDQLFFERTAGKYLRSEKGG